VALARGDVLLGSERRAMRHGHGEVLLPMIAAVMGPIPPAEIEIVATTVGPGGFTGIRVGLAAAQGIALAAGARTIGVTSFAAVAAQLATDRDRPVLVTIDSRRRDLYVQLFAAAREPIEPGIAIVPEELPAYIAGLIGNAPLLVAGDAIDAAAAALAGRIGIDFAPASAPDAVGVLAAARSVWYSGAEPELPSPLYLRPPDVTVPEHRAAAAPRVK
jgi:tRNA threonylcarbamoyladenosine biosynthesis protein TsaB